MSPRKPWRELDRRTVGRAPERYGMCELGDGEGAVVNRGAGLRRAELKEALAYDDARKARWETATSEEHARNLLDEHR